MSEIPSWRSQALKTLRSLESKFLKPAPIKTEQQRKQVVAARQLINRGHPSQDPIPLDELMLSLAQEFEPFKREVVSAGHYETALTAAAWREITTLLVIAGSTLQCIHQWNQTLAADSISKQIEEAVSAMRSQPADAGWQAVSCCRAVATMGTQLVEANDVLADVKAYSFPHPDQSLEDVRVCLLEAIEGDDPQAFDVMKTKLSRAENREWTSAHVNAFTHREFEFLIADLWETYGYKTNVTQGKRDRGLDVECRADGDLVLIEAKQHSGNVGSKVCQQAAGLYKEHDPDEVVLLTTSGFTQPAIERATQNDVRLIAGGELRERLTRTPLVPPLDFL